MPAPNASASNTAAAYPGEVAGVAALSGGSYTLPRVHDAEDHPLNFPFGVSDLDDIGFQPFDRAQFEEIPFWVGVGADDVNPSDTSRAWDGFEGITRVQRAEAFVGAVHSLNGSAELHVFAHVGHDETAGMRAAACAFLRSVAENATP